MKHIELRSIKYDGYADTSEVYLHENGYIVLMSHEKIGDAEPAFNMFILRPDEAKKLADAIVDGAK